MNDPVCQQLIPLGWNDFFDEQVSDLEREITPPVRVISVHGRELEIISEAQRTFITLPGTWSHLDPHELPTVGDWLLFEPSTMQPVRLLERSSLVKRKAAGARAFEQLIAANIDTLFIVTSCNFDFNLPRLERYLILAFESEVEPVLLLTKSDLCDDVTPYIEQAHSLYPDLKVLCVNSKSPEIIDQLAPWCGPGKTVTLVGSSGVGKSTLTNTLLGGGSILTSAIREDDSRGRHTTTARTLHPLPQGGVVIDTPGMRELQLADCEGGLNTLFEDIADLALTCKFTDCSHRGVKGCAIEAAIEAGTLHPRRVESYLKILAEQAHNAASIAELRKKERRFSKTVKAAVKDQQRRKG